MAQRCCLELSVSETFLRHCQLVDMNTSHPFTSCAMMACYEQILVCLASPLSVIPLAVMAYLSVFLSLRFHTSPVPVDLAKP